MVAMLEILPPPSPAYLAELGFTHLRFVGHDGLRRSHDALLQHMPEALHPDFDSWHYPAHLGEIPETGVALAYDRMPPASIRLRTVTEGSGLMAMLAVADGVGGTYYEGRSSASTGLFWDKMTRSFADHEVQEVVPDGPPNQRDALDFAGIVGEWLDLEERPRERVRATFLELREKAVMQLDESASQGAQPDPESLLDIAKDTGALVTQMGVDAFVGYRNRERGTQVRRVAGHIGAYGGIEEHGSNPRYAIERGVDTYATALIRRHGALEGLRLAAEMRRDAEADNRREAKELLRTPRERRIYRTVTFFARAANWLARMEAGLEGKDVSQAARELDELILSTAQERNYPSPGAA